MLKCKEHNNYRPIEVNNLFIYPYNIMNGESLKHTDITNISHFFLCDYDIPDSYAIRKYIGYFVKQHANNRNMSVTSYKLLPIKEPNA